MQYTKIWIYENSIKQKKKVFGIIEFIILYLKQRIQEIQKIRSHTSLKQKIQKILETRSHTRSKALKTPNSNKNIAFKQTQKILYKGKFC